MSLTTECQICQQLAALYVKEATVIPSSPQIALPGTCQLSQSLHTGPFLKADGLGYLNVVDDSWTHDTTSPLDKNTYRLILDRFIVLVKV